MMPTPPTFTQPCDIVGTANYLTTWGKLRSPIVSEYFNFSYGNNSLNVESGFHPDECYFVRCIGWPSSEQYYDENNVLQTEYRGLITGYLFVAIASPNDPGTTRTALGAYSTELYYFNLQGSSNYLDFYDRQDFFDGMTINGAYTATNDFYGDETSDFWQTFTKTSINGDVVDTIGGLNSLSGMTKF